MKRGGKGEKLYTNKKEESESSNITKDGSPEQTHRRAVVYDHECQVNHQ